MQRSLKKEIKPANKLNGEQVWLTYAIPIAIGMVSKAGSKKMIDFDRGLPVVEGR